MKRFILIVIIFFLTTPLFGQDMMRPQVFKQKKEYSPAWKTNPALRLEGFAHVFPIEYKVWDVTKQVNKSRQKVSIELLHDGSYMVYWPVEDKTAYVHLAPGFAGLGALVNELLYGDPDSLIKPKALEQQ